MIKILAFISFLLVLGNVLALSLPKVSKGLGPRQEVQLHAKYILGWQVNTETQEIFFDVKVETHGFVGFGINSIGSMIGADIVIGGVDSDGNSYFSDRHGTGTIEPIIDEEENWLLLEASEDETHTFLKFSRKWDTCDKDGDFKINDDTLRIIWSFGETDTIEYHKDNKGVREFNFLDGPPPPIDISQFEKWELRVNDVMPTHDTSYWCTVHKSPSFPAKRHLVGFNTFLENELAVKHTHHFIAAKCKLPEGVDADEFFAPYLGQPGGDCENGGSHAELKNVCHEYLYIWAVGGQMMLFPEHVGYSMGEENENEYILLEIHYDNPSVESGIQFTSGFDVFYTDQIRPQEAELIIMGHDVHYTQILPPNTEEFVISGHCSPECTRAGIPDGSGINIFNYFFHAHLAGRKMKLHHYRDNKELPWFASDATYDFNYQQTRNLRDEIVLKPGDQLSLECTFNTIGRENATFAGLGTKEEMCQVYTWYYPKGSLKLCSSEYEPYQNLFNDVLGLGIDEIDSTEHFFDPIIVKPETLAGKHISELINTQVVWTPELIENMQNLLHGDPHLPLCSAAEDIEWVAFPQVDEIYQPIDMCEGNEVTSTTDIQTDTTPNIQTQTPDIQTDTTPNIQTQTPDYQTQTPDIQTGTPDFQTQTPDYQTQTPDIQTGTPDFQTQTPDIQTGTPDFQTGTPDFQTGTPDYQTETPDIQTGTPDFQTGTPDIQTQTPDFQTTPSSQPDTSPNGQPDTSTNSQTDTTPNSQPESTPNSASVSKMSALILILISFLNGSKYF